MADPTILLAFSDVTARRAIEREKAELQIRTDELLSEKQVLLATRTTSASRGTRQSPRSKAFAFGQPIVRKWFISFKNFGAA
jgi:hypothetical protein